jgi:hypothetical protein
VVKQHAQVAGSSRSGAIVMNTASAVSSNSMTRNGQQTRSSSTIRLTRAAAFGA